MFDKWLATEADKKAARFRADDALRKHGDRAVAHLEHQLTDRARRKSRRPIRLAIALIQSHSH